MAERGLADEARLKALPNEVRLGDAYYISYLSSLFELKYGGRGELFCD